MTAKLTAILSDTGNRQRTSADSDFLVLILSGHHRTSMDVRNAVFKTAGSDAAHQGRDEPSRTATHAANGGIWRYSAAPCEFESAILNGRRRSVNARFRVRIPVPEPIRIRNRPPTEFSQTPSLATVTTIALERGGGQRRSLT